MNEIVYGYTGIIPVSVFKYPELVELHRKMLIQRMFHSNPTLPLDAKITWAPEVPFRYEETGEFYEDEGEQVPEIMVVECSRENATYVLLMCEASA